MSDVDPPLGPATGSSIPRLSLHGLIPLCAAGRVSMPACELRLMGEHSGILPVAPNVWGWSLFRKSSSRRPELALEHAGRSLTRSQIESWPSCSSIGRRHRSRRPVRWRQLQRLAATVGCGALRISCPGCWPSSSNMRLALKDLCSLRSNRFSRAWFQPAEGTHHQVWSD